MVVLVQGGCHSAMLGLRTRQARLSALRSYGNDRGLGSNKTAGENKSGRPGNILGRCPGGILCTQTVGESNELVCHQKRLPERQYCLPGRERLRRASTCICFCRARGCQCTEYCMSIADEGLLIMVSPVRKDPPYGVPRPHS